MGRTSPPPQRKQHRAFVGLVVGCFLLFFFLISLKLVNVSKRKEREG